MEWNYFIPLMLLLSMIGVLILNYGIYHPKFSLWFILLFTFDKNERNKLESKLAALSLKAINFQIVELTDDYFNYVSNRIQIRWKFTEEQACTEINRWLCHDGNSMCYIAVVDDKPIGIGVFDTINDPRYGNYSPWFNLLWVEPEWRGCGYGQEITRKRIEYARSLGYDKVYMDTKDAASYHLKFGWKIVSKITGFKYVPEMTETFDITIMDLELDNYYKR